VIHDDIAAFAAALPPARGIAGLDFGTKTIGVAVSDALRSVATPLVTIKRSKFTKDAAELVDIIAKRDLAGLVLGLPRNMDGSEGRARNPPAPSPGTSPGTRISRAPHHVLGRTAQHGCGGKGTAGGGYDTKTSRRGDRRGRGGYILQGALDRLRHIEANK
jgi:putative Holliday junction resolvase